MSKGKDMAQKAAPFFVSNIANIAAFLIPLVAIVVFDVNYFIFYAAFFLEICAYMVTCLVRVSRFTSSKKHILTAVSIMMPGILVSAATSLIFILLTSSKADDQSSLIPKLVMLLTLGLVIVNQLKVYKAKISKTVDCYSKINSRYMAENQPEQDLIPANHIVFGSVCKGYGFFAYNAVVCLIAFVFADILISLLRTGLQHFALFFLLALKFTTDLMKAMFIEDEWDENKEEEWAETYAKQIANGKKQTLVLRSDPSVRLT